MTITSAAAHRPTVAFPIAHPRTRLHSVTQDHGPARGHRHSISFTDTTTTAPATARELVRKHAPASIADIAELAASELVTNVARHAPGAARLCMTVTAAVLVLSVTDQHPELPVQRPGPDAAFDLDDESGRGLAMILAFGAQLAVRCDAGRKRVTARLPIPEGDPT